MFNIGHKKSKKNTEQECWAVYLPNEQSSVGKIPSQGRKKDIKKVVKQRRAKQKQKKERIIVDLNHQFWTNRESNPGPLPMTIPEEETC